VIKDVRVRESTIAINSAMSRILPFPCMFQIVADKIAAFDQAMLQPYQVIILPLRSAETFSNSSFLEYIKSVDSQGAPEVIYLVEAGDEGDDVDDSKRLLHLTADSSIPMHELAQVLASIVHAPAAHFPAANVSADSGDMEDSCYTADIHSAIPDIPAGRVPSRSAGRSQGAKRKISFAEAAPVPSAAAGAGAQSAYDPAAAYQHWQAAQARMHHWFVETCHARGYGNGNGGAAPVRGGALQHRVVSADEPTDRLSCESTDFMLSGSGDGGVYCGGTSTSSSSAAELEITADDEEAFNCCLDGFDDTDELFTHGPNVRD
jgi:hypothetical protein